MTAFSGCLRRIQGPETTDFRSFLRDEREHRFCIGRRRGPEGVQAPGVPSVAEQGHHRDAHCQRQEEDLRVAGLLQKFEPAMYQGKPVCAYFDFPVTFHVN